jgi:predicted RNase H-like HicB family nuclease
MFRKSENPKQYYRIVIEWSREDQVYTVELPDFPGKTPFTHGDSYREAEKASEEVLELLFS